jgi:L-galactono-1,4-lactone dehydrogenase
VKPLTYSLICLLTITCSLLSCQHIKEINRAESEYWEGSQVTRVADSVQVLGFDCGGEQWVLEVCVPMGHCQDSSSVDVDFAKELLELIEHVGVPAACPIEQR